MSRHPLFRHYPLRGAADTSIGSLPKPYHVYNGHGMLIGGTADFDGAGRLLQNESVSPQRTSSGEALMAIWICDFTSASLDPHTELQISFLVSTVGEAPSVPDRRLGMLLALTTYPEVGMFCHGLWNNSEKVMIYNRELLGLPAELAESEIVRENGRKLFTFRDEAGEPICSGNVAEATTTSFGMIWAMLRLFGLRRMLRLAREPVLSTSVINPRSDAFPHNVTAETHLASDTPILQAYHPGRDTLTFAREPYASLDFQPLFMEHFAPFRFVYLMPG